MGIVYNNKPNISDCFKSNRYSVIYYDKVQEIAYIRIDRTKTDTGRLVEYTKALERTILKELGKMIP